MKGNTLETIHVAGYIDIDAVIAKQSQFAKYQWVSLSIGNDDKIYCLFAERVPERIQGMFVPTTNNSRYIAYVFTVDWHSGEVYSSQLVDFGVITINVHYLQPIWEKLLLLGARAHYNDGNPDQNALIIEEGGNEFAHFCLGDGIQDCIVDSQNNILTSYFDEGVFGNFRWGGSGANEPIGTSGLVKWSETGEKIWENKNHAICDCYAMNIDDLDNLWFYYYTKFNLVKTNYRTETIFHPKISGSGGFLISQDQNSLLFHKGYNENGFCIVNILYGFRQKVLYPHTASHKQGCLRLSGLCGYVIIKRKPTIANFPNQRIVKSSLTIIRLIHNNVRSEVPKRFSWIQIENCISLIGISIIPDGMIFVAKT